MNPSDVTQPPPTKLDADQAEQSRPGYGIPSQDPRPGAQTPLQPKEAAREARSVLTLGGAMAGAATGAVIGVAVAGPVGVMVGGTLGAVAGALGSTAAGAGLQPAADTDIVPAPVIASDASTVDRRPA